MRPFHTRVFSSVQRIVPSVTTAQSSSCIQLHLNSYLSASAQSKQLALSKDQHHSLSNEVGLKKKKTTLLDTLAEQQSV